MQTETRLVSEIKPMRIGGWASSDAALQATKREVIGRGFACPVIVDALGFIVCGTRAWQAAVALRIEEIPVHVARDFTGNEISAYRDADQAVARLVDWDPCMLSRTFGTMRGADIDWSLLGFDVVRCDRPDPVRDASRDIDRIRERRDGAA